MKRWVQVVDRLSDFQITDPSAAYTTAFFTRV